MSEKPPIINEDELISSEVSESENTDIEKSPHPSLRYVMDIFRKHEMPEAFEVIKEIEDEEGLCILEVQTRDKDGEIVQYNYIRAGKSSAHDKNSNKTVIDIIYFSMGIPWGGDQVAMNTDGEWVKQS